MITVPVEYFIPEEEKAKIVVAERKRLREQTKGLRKPMMGVTDYFGYDGGWNAALDAVLTLLDPNE